GPAFGAANRVQHQRPALDADAVEQRGQHLQHFGVTGWRFASRIGWPDDLGADLEELAIASLLRTLAAKLRSHVVKLLQSRTLPHLVLYVGADDAGGILWTQRQRLPTGLTGGTAAVFPGVHLLGDDVGLFANAAR